MPSVHDRFTLVSDFEIRVVSDDAIFIRGAIKEVLETLAVAQAGVRNILAHLGLMEAAPEAEQGARTHYRFARKAKTFGRLSTWSGCSSGGSFTTC